jgi:uncharacterized protein YaiL (DUF2058 family)
MNSLREQLLKAGLAKPVTESPKSERSSGPRPHYAKQRPAGPSVAPSRPKPQKSDDQVSLAKAYQLRAETEQRELALKKQLQAEQKAKRKAAVERIKQLIASHAQASEGAERCRYFPYGKKIKRHYLTETQNTEINNGNLGLVQLEGRFYLFPAAQVEEVLALGREFVALFRPENKRALEDENPEYSDPKYQVPDDLVW